MKNIKTIVNLFIIVSVFSSCSITKRHYLPGYSVKWRTANKMEKGLNAIPSGPSEYVNNSNSVDEPEMPVSASTAETEIVKKPASLYLKLVEKRNVSKSAADCDLITLRNGEEINGKVLEISQTEIKYKRCDNLEGPTIIIDKAGVTQIKYANGTTELIRTESPKKVEEPDYYSPGAKAPPVKRYNSDQKIINKFALASMISAITSVVWIPLALSYVPWLIVLAPVPIILGIIALKEIKRNPELYKGKGMAVFGIIFSGVEVAIILIFLLLFLLLFLLI
ncbi:MAG: DUF4190 domain-containing protein [Bacteroidota bacterium]